MTHKLQDSLFKTSAGIIVHPYEQKGELRLLPHTTHKRNNSNWTTDITRAKTVTLLEKRSANIF